MQISRLFNFAHVVVSSICDHVRVNLARRFLLDRPSDLSASEFQATWSLPRNRMPLVRSLTGCFVFIYWMAARYPAALAVSHRHLCALSSASTSADETECLYSLRRKVSRALCTR